ncbi:MAG: hypothetical protein BWZ10_00774 [candidate division BRC1 bacterium ADurb.BinA364]|nr:MAG: hypothetical protein BWZ10_00774 [candidate division BRC1 bacterium ADurb.BinA364]
MRRRRAKSGQVLQEISFRQTLRRFSAHARKRKPEHRRRCRGHSRPHARPHRADGDEDGQTCLCREAAGAFDSRDSPAPANRARNGRRLADGHPGTRQGRRTAFVRMDLGRSHRRGARGALLDQPADLASGHRSSRRIRSRAADIELGFMAWRSAGEAVSFLLRSLQMARLVGFRQRRDGRHGLPLHGRRLLGSEAGRAIERNRRKRSDQRRDISEILANRFRVSRSGRFAAGQDSLAGRRAAAA